MLPYVFHPLAAAELDEAVGYYEAVAPGKGWELAEQIQVAIAQLQRFPESAPVTQGFVRSAATTWLGITCLCCETDRPPDRSYRWLDGVHSA